ncbi:MAG TPA: FAD-dependent oxidoreductase [Caulobacterales bacterium]|nr:FAD-dependent oxidoreductase [Caulobacterales bacterium]
MGPGQPGSLYQRALSPIRIGGVEIKNRIVRTAHATMLARGGGVTDELIAYHLARAEGGVGLSILEAAGVHASSVLSLANLDDSIIDGYRRIAEAIAPTGMKLFQQLWHGGHIYPAPTGGPSFSPSGVPSHIAGVSPTPMRVADIEEVVACYARAAKRCELGGLDGVEVHAGHGYLLAQFLSPVLNQREDDYGGDLAGRMRFLREVLASVRAAVSREFPVGVRLSDSADARILSMAEVAEVARRLKSEGLIDYVNVSYGDYYASHRQVGAMDAPTGYQIPFTSAAVEGIGIPRLLTGRFRTLEEVEQVLRAGEADLISMVRAHIADPDIVAKSAAGHSERVRPCIACNQGCLGRAATFGRLGCAVNTAAGDETKLAEKNIRKSATPLRVFVAGGGPGGMEAARIAALAGHRVTLAEATSTLGGLTTSYRRAPRMQTIADFIGWQEQEIYRLGVDVRLSAYVEAEDILAERPDHVIVATGADHELSLVQAQAPAEPIERAAGATIVTAIDLFGARDKNWGAHALVVDEHGHYEAIAAAEYLLEQGLAVTFATRHKMFAPQIDITLRTQPALERLYAKGPFKLLVSTQIVAIGPGEAVLKPLFGPQTETIPADVVVWAPMRSGAPWLAHALKDAGVATSCIGDALAGRNIQTAVREGHLAARALAD